MEKDAEFGTYPCEKVEHLPACKTVVDIEGRMWGFVTLGELVKIEPNVSYPHHRLEVEDSAETMR